MPTFTITTSPGWAFRVAMPSVAFVLSSSLPSRDNTWMVALPLSVLYVLNGRKVTVWILFRYKKVKI